MSLLSAQDRYQKESDLVRTIQANIHDPGIHALLELLDVRIGKLHDRLLKCQVEEFLEARAMAVQLSNLRREIDPRLTPSTN